MAQLVYRRAMGWTPGVRIPAGEDFFSSTPAPWNPGNQLKILLDWTLLNYKRTRVI